MKLNIQEPDRPIREQTVAGDVVRVGRDVSCEIAFDEERFPKVSGLHAEFQRRGKDVFIVHRSRSNRTLYNEQPLAVETKVKPGDRIRLGFTGPELIVVSLSEAKSVAPIAADASQETRMAVNGAEVLRGSAQFRSMPIGGGGVLGRDAADTTYCLNHPLVSRLHARITVKNGQFILTDLSSANGTFVNGQRLAEPRQLTVDDTIDIGPFTLVFDGRSLASRSRANNVQLVVSQVGRVVQDASKKTPLTLLDDIALVFNPGEFVAIIGPSGSGKSTLLGVISGRTQPSSGRVTVNGQNLHTHFAALKQDLVVVPQHTMLHETLTVEQSLDFTAALRLPPDTSDRERVASVDKILEAVGLTHRKTVRIKQLSGGQLKRAGLGGELLSEPSLLFLDEVTSGLDEHSDGEMMRLFRKLAEQGKTLACVTHNLAHVEENCHLVTVLTVGGRLAFFGRPVESLDYFGVERLADVYTELAAKQPEEWARAYRLSDHFAKYVLSRQPTANTSVPSVRPRNRDEIIVSFMRQWLVLVQRNVAIWRNDLPALAALFGQSLLVAMLLCLVFGSVASGDAGNEMTRLAKVRNLLFLVGVSSFWLGCNNSVKEIVKERSIFQRERDFNLIPEAYLASKLLVMSMLGLVQALLLGGIVYSWCGVSGSMFWHFANLIGLSLAGTTLGLGISSLVKTEEVAVAAVPIVIIPQIILAGVVTGLTAVPEFLSRLFVTVYWGQKGSESIIDEYDRIPADFEPFLAVSLFVLALHCCIYFGAAWYGTRRV